MILNEKFLYSHFPKSGGTFIRNFLLETTESTYLKGQDHRPLSLFNSDDSDPIEQQNRGVLFDQRHGTTNGRKVIFDHLENKNVVGSLRNPLDWYPSRLGYAKFRGNNLKFQNFDISSVDLDEFIQNLDTGLFSNSNDPVIWRRLRFELDFFEIAKRCKIGLMSFEFILQYSHDPLRVFRNGRIASFEDMYILPRAFLHLENIGLGLQQLVSNFSVETKDKDNVFRELGVRKRDNALPVKNREIISNESKEKIMKLDHVILEKFYLDNFAPLSFV